MKDLKIYIVLLLGIVFCVGIYLWGIYCSPKIPSDIDVLNSKIDSLEHKIDSLNIKRDSIRLIVDTSKVCLSACGCRLRPIRKILFR